MRSDAKIGMLIGAAVIVVAGWYFLRDGQPDRQIGTEPVQEPLRIPVPEVADDLLKLTPADPNRVEPDQAQAQLRIPPPVDEPATQPIEPPDTSSDEPSISPRPVEPVKPVAHIHVVEAGDSFAKLAQQYYGSQRGSYVALLMRTNPDVDPRRMKVGQQIVIPPLAAPQTAQAKPAGPVLPGMYRVQKGDTFYDIAKRLCGNGKRWRELYKLNRDVIGDDPSSLRPGHVLKLPADWPGSQR